MNSPDGQQGYQPLALSAKLSQRVTVGGSDRLAKRTGTQLDNGMSRIAVVVLFSAVFTYGCAPSALERPQGTQAVVRHVNWRKWKRLRPEQSVAFGSYQVVAPDKSAAGGRTTTISLQPQTYQKSDLKGTIEFDLLEAGMPVAHVTAASARKVLELNTGNDVGTLGIDDLDQMDGHIEIIDQVNAEFSITGFHKGSLRGEAHGVLTVNQSRITLREVDAAWHEQGYGFAGAEFHLHDQHVGQVVCGRQETVWVDPNQPPEIRTAIASVAATILMTDRLEPNPM